MTKQLIEKHKQSNPYITQELNVALAIVQKVHGIAHRKACENSHLETFKEDRDNLANLVKAINNLRDAIEAYQDK